MTIASQLELLANTKSAIKTAIEAKGVTVGTVPFSEYPVKIADITTGGGAGYTVPDSWSAEWHTEVLDYANTQAWVRPADWLAMPTVLATDQKFVALVLVENTGTNWVDISATGAFSVDWGDGVTENFASGAVATHNYNWSSIPSNTLTSTGYRQVVFTVTPQAGETLSIIKMGNAISGLTNYQPRIVDVAFAMNGTGDFQRASVILNNELKRLRWIGNNLKTSFANFFENMTGLESVEVYTGSATNMNSMFRNCYSLKIIPSIITNNVTTATDMFQNCYSLVTIPALTFTSLTTLTGMFQQCWSLITTPAMSLPNAAVNISNLFLGCGSLLYVGDISWNANTTDRTVNMTSVCNGCLSLLAIPNFINTFSGGNILISTASNCFSSCGNIRTATVNLSTGNISGLFASCGKLTTLTLRLFSGTSNISSFSAFSNCGNLESLTFEYPVNTVTFTPSGWAAQLSNATKLRSISINCDTGTTTANNFASGRSLTKLILNNCVASVNCSNCALGPAELEALFTSLGTASAKTITITGNWGASLLSQGQRDIAINKGWTIVG